MRTLAAALILALGTLPLTPTLLAGEPDPAREFERAFFKEQAERDLEGALAIYQALIARHDAGRELAAKALVRVGACLSSLGRKAEARRAFERVLSDFPAEKGPVLEARKELDRLDREAKAGAGGTAPSPNPPPPSEADRIRTVLQDQTITLDFKDAPLQDVFHFIRNTKGVNIVCDPAVLRTAEAEGRTVNLSLDEIQVGSALKLIARFNGLSEAVLHDVIYVADSNALAWYRTLWWPGAPVDMEPAPGPGGSALTVDFTGKTLREALSILKSAWRFPLEASPAADALLDRTLGAFDETDIAPADLFEKLLGPSGMLLAPTRKGYRVITRGELATLRAEREAMNRSLEILPASRVLQTLRTRVVSLDFMDTPLLAMLRFLSEVAGINIVLAPSPNRDLASLPVTLAVDDVSLESALRLALMPLNLEYRIEGDVVVVEERP